MVEIHGPTDEHVACPPRTHLRSSSLYALNSPVVRVRLWLELAIRPEFTYGLNSPYNQSSPTA
uniref:Uncharacterized protein n=1 Tax=Asparagus officinalis TaxID=4686 RepID=Q2AA12_ASPOF|nr:hypothetical protein 20.t00016 [Asparagus officinalis]